MTDLPTAIERFLNPSAESEPVYNDTEFEPIFTDLDLGLELEEPLQSQIPAWLEGAESLAKLHPRGMPPELTQLAQLSQGDPSQAVIDSLTAEISPRGTAPKQDLGAVAFIGFALLALVFGARLSTTKFGGGKAGW